jgi:hypothetical protein
VVLDDLEAKGPEGGADAVAQEAGESDVSPTPNAPTMPMF